MRARDGFWRTQLESHGPLAAVIALSLPLLWPATYPGDHFTFWAAGHIVATGGSPYAAAAWADPGLDAAAASGLVVDMRAVIARCCSVLWTYPPWTAVALAPFGALPVGVGIPLFHLVSLATAVTGAVGLARSLPWTDPRRYALALVLFALFEPFVLGVRGGHFVGLLLAGAWLVQIGILRDRAGAIVAGAVLLSLKPHVVVPFAVVVLCILVARRRWSTIAWTSAVLGAIVVASLVAYPDSLAAIAGGATERAAVQGATPWTLVATILGEPVPLVVIALQLGLALACLQGARLAPPALRMHAVLALTLVADLALVPYVQDHDQLLLAPALFLALRYGDLAGSGRRRYIALVGLAFVLAPWLIQVPTVVAYTPSLAGAVPFLAAAAALAGTAIARANRTEGRPAGGPPLLR